MAQDNLTVLVIDDDPGDAELLYRQLDDIPGRDVEFLAFTDLNSGLEELRKRDVDIIFIDYLLGAETGLHALNAIKAAGISRPVIMLTGQGNEKVAVEAMKAGAADYLIKRFTSTDDLHRTLLNALEKAALHQKIEDQRKEMERLARTDGLTCVHNRRFFMETLQKSVARALQESRPLSLLLVDLDHFKLVNDSHGHLTGDTVLARSAEIIQGVVSEPDYVGRFGGEEFCVTLEGKGLARAIEIAEEIRSRLGVEAYQPHEDSTVFHVTGSIGVAELNPAAADVESFIRMADNALYRAKQAGRNRVCV